MTASALHGLDAGPGSVPSWLRALGAALDGEGPALMPLPRAPSPVLERLVAQLRPDDPLAPVESTTPPVALVVPTSGSSGPPKGALLTRSAVIASAQATHRRLGGPGRWVIALPHTHVAGLMVLARSLVAGLDPVEVDSTDGFRPEEFVQATACAQAKSAGEPLYSALVPTQLDRLLDASVDLTGYAAILVGAAAAAPTLLERATRAGAHIVTTYGMTETCGGCVYDGVPLDGVTVALDPGGRILLGGSTLYSGYRLRPDLTAAATGPDGELITADLGSFTVDGGLEILGRADDVIITGGENVVPRTVEAAITELGGVRQCVVLGVADTEWGQRVVAVIETGIPAGPDGDDAVHAELRRGLADRLPLAWIPKEFVITGEIPLLATGKPDRTAVRRLAEGYVRHG